MIKFLHASDIHIDSPLRGLSRYESAPVELARGATRSAFERMVDLALEEDVAFVLIAGDLYDGDWKDYNTGLFFCSQMARLERAGIRALVVAGNHDAASAITRRLRPPANVHLFATDRPETIRLDDMPVAVHGQGYPETAVRDDLAAGFPDAAPGAFNVGLLHTSLDGRPGHEPYAPCSLSGLRARGYDYWALGHVHAREVVCEDPWVIFPGCIQGRHARETGPKGATLVTVSDGAVAAVEHRDLDVLRWTVRRVELDEVEDEAGFVTGVRASLQEAVDEAGDLPVAVRVVLDGVCPFHARLRAEPDRWLQQVRAIGIELDPDRVWIEKVEDRTRGLRPLAKAAAAGTAVGELLRDIEGDDDDPQAPPGLEEAVSELVGKLPPETFAEGAGDDPARPDVLADIVAEARGLLVARLLEEEEDAS